MPDVVEEKHYILELIGDFVEYLEIEKGRSKKLLRIINVTWKDFCTLLGN